jgi:uncharacterized protein YqiB (DUF1249 family)
VRLYHDARVAEVLGFQGQGRFKPHYDYPNEQMYLPDEKRQVNLMLRDVLNYCRARRFTFADPSIYGKRTATK